MTPPLDVITLARFVLALVLVLGLIVVSGWIVRKSGGMALAARVRSAKRLHILEVLQVDARHRLVLFRRDRVSHLVLLGPSGPVVVERDIAADMDPPDRASTPPDEEPSP